MVSEGKGQIEKIFVGSSFTWLSVSNASFSEVPVNFTPEITLLEIAVDIIPFII
jgi:hypothetical protein